MDNTWGGWGMVSKFTELSVSGGGTYANMLED